MIEVIVELHDFIDQEEESLKKHEEHEEHEEQVGGGRCGGEEAQAYKHKPVQPVISSFIFANCRLTNCS